MIYSPGALAKEAHGVRRMKRARAEQEIAKFCRDKVSISEITKTSCSVPEILVSDICQYILNYRFSFAGELGV